MKVNLYVLILNIAEEAKVTSFWYFHVSKIFKVTTKMYKNKPLKAQFMDIDNQIGNVTIFVFQFKST